MESFSMKRLFQVEQDHGDVFYAQSKAAAKEMRDANPGSCVSKGPDHWRYGVKGNPRTHSHNSKSGGHGNGFPRKVK